MGEVKIGEDTPFELLLKITEDERRSRIKRLVSGDETAALTFRKPAEKDVKKDDKTKAGAAYGSSGGSRVVPARPGARDMTRTSSYRPAGAPSSAPLKRPAPP